MAARWHRRWTRRLCSTPSPICCNAGSATVCPTWPCRRSAWQRPCSRSSRRRAAMAAEFAIVCKTYRADLRRAQRLLASLARHNRERIPVVVIVPRDDLEVFRDGLQPSHCELVADEDVVAAHPEADARDLQARYRATPGYRSQQVIKAEAWRLLGCETYLCADADAMFLRDFGLADFLGPG